MSVVAGTNEVFRAFIDAASGVELQRYSMLQKQSAVGTGRGVVGDTKKMSVLRQGGAFLADDQLRPPVLTTFDMRGNLNRALNVLIGAPLFASDVASDTDNDWTDLAAVDAHAHVGWTYDYYFKRHGRRGLDNRDRPLISLINGVTQQGALALPPEDFGLFAINAFWCDACGPNGVGTIYFGNGFPQPFVDELGRNWTYLAGSLDVVAHELTHGVTSSSSNLIPGDEPGALNEAFSDMMGTSVEFFFQVPGAGNWPGRLSHRRRQRAQQGWRAQWASLIGQSIACSEIPITTASSSPVPRTRVEFIPIRRFHLTRSISPSRAAGIASPVSPFKASEQPIASR